MEDQNVTLYSMKDPMATYGIAKRENINIIKRWDKMSPTEQLDIFRQAFRTFSICEYCGGQFYFID